MATAVTNSTQTLVDAVNGTKAKTTSTTAEAQDRFLKLLTTQLKNQDPLNPMDNAHVARSAFDARVASQDDLVEALSNGVKVESYGETAQTEIAE